MRLININKKKLSMKVNFSKVKITSSLERGEEVVDLRHFIGDIAYQKAKSLEDDMLARRIFNSNEDEEIELNEKECDYLLTVSKDYTWPLQRAISNLVGNKTQE